MSHRGTRDVATDKRSVDAAVDAMVMARLRAPFGCEFIKGNELHRTSDRWRIHDANDDAIASVSGREEGYARIIVKALNECFARRAKLPPEADDPEQYVDDEPSGGPP